MSLVIVTCRAWGLLIRSSVPLPELQAVESGEEPQVVIHTGEVPRALDNPTVQSGLFQADARRYLLTVEGVARYLVSDGRSIVIEPFPGHDDDSVRLFLLGSVFGALLRQRGLTPLHASAVRTPGGAIVFAGRCGSGKSALAAALYRRGYPLVADEICAVSILDGGAYIAPAPPRLLLLPDVVECLGLDGPGVRPARPGILKRHVPALDGFEASPIRIRRIYALTTTGVRELSLTAITGSRKVMQIVLLRFRRSSVAGVPVEEDFNSMVSLARHIDFFQLGRPQGKSSLSETADLVERDFAR